MLQEKLDLAPTARTPGTPALRVVVCGEINSGKSTVLNALLRSRILPDNIGRLTRPVVIAGYRDTPGVEVEFADGRVLVDESFSPDELLSTSFEGAAVVRLWSDRKHLAGVEIVEVPMTKAEELTEEQVSLVRSADVMIWVTIASQAWRLTEKTIVEKLGEARPSQAILAVTRADKLRSARDQARLKERMELETSQYFGQSVFVGGAPGVLGKSSVSEADWVQTGGAEIMSILQEFSPQEPALYLVEGMNDVEEEAVNEAVTSTVDIVEFNAFRTRVERSDTANVTAATLPEAGPERGAPPIEINRMRAGAAPAARSAEAVPGDAPVARTDAPEPEREDAAEVRERLAALLAELRGVIVGGVCTTGGAETFEALHGDAELARQVGIFCHRLHRNLSQTLSQGDEPGGVSSLNFSTKAHRMLLLDAEGVGLIYLMVDADVMSQGSAQSALSRLSRVIES